MKLVLEKGDQSDFLLNKAVEFSANVNNDDLKTALLKRCKSER